MAAVSKIRPSAPSYQNSKALLRAIPCLLLTELSPAVATTSSWKHPLCLAQWNFAFELKFGLYEWVDNGKQERRLREGAKVHLTSCIPPCFYPDVEVQLRMYMRLSGMRLSGTMFTCSRCLGAQWWKL